MRCTLLILSSFLFSEMALAETIRVPVLLPDTLKKSAPIIATLKPHHVVTTARLHSPKILAAKELENTAEGAILEAEGAFDASIEQDISSRIDGFYDGQQIDTRLVKPFAPMNSTFYTGYRLSDGSFPIYEDKNITTEDGEWLIGAKLSLLRNRNIDARRLGLKNALLEQERTQAEIFQTTLAIEEEAQLYYWEWVAAGFSYNTYHQLLDVANERQQAFESQFKAGDIARIYLTENQQYIVRRKIDVTNARRKLQQAAIALSLYYRNIEGKPIIAQKSQLPDSLEEITTEDSTAVSEAWLQQRPEVLQLERQAEQLENQLLFNKNNRLPKADLMLEHANDYGSGLESREEAETIVKLNISFPLQQNKADGAIAQTQAKLRQLEHQQTQRLEELQLRLEELIVILNTAQEYVALATQEIALAKEMQTAEQQRVNNGDSDYFLLVLRDENLIKAQLKIIAANTLYHQTKVSIDILTANLQ